MRFVIKEHEIEMSPDTEHDRDVLARMHRFGTVKVMPGDSTDRNWPPDPRKTNVIFKFDDGKD